MKRILLLLAVLVLSAAVSGPLKAQAMMQANPYVGTWKLNLEKSKITGVPAPKSLTREVVADGAGAKYTYKGTAADGKAIDYSFATNYDCKDGAISGSGAPGGADALSIKRISANKTEAIVKRDGKEIGKSAAEVSKDGKITTIRGSGKTPDGKAYSYVLVFETQ